MLFQRFDVAIDKLKAVVDSFKQLDFSDIITKVIIDACKKLNVPEILTEVVPMNSSVLKKKIHLRC